jgi:hypothetical protein
VLTEKIRRHSSFRLSHSSLIAMLPRDPASDDSFRLGIPALEVYIQHEVHSKLNSFHEQMHPWSFRSQLIAIVWMDSAAIQSTESHHQFGLKPSFISEKSSSLPSNHSPLRRILLMVYRRYRFARWYGSLIPSATVPNLSLSS